MVKTKIDIVGVYFLTFKAISKNFSFVILFFNAIGILKIMVHIMLFIYFFLLYLSLNFKAFGT